MIQDTRGNQDAFDLLWRTIEEDGWNPDLPEDQPRTVRGVFEGSNGRFWTYAKIPEDIDLLLCYSRVPYDAPPELIPSAAELVQRLNYGLRLGNFEIDLDSGLVRFKSSIDFRNIPLSRTLIMNVLLPCAYGLDRFLPAFDALVMDGESVQGAIARLGSDF